MRKGAKDKSEKLGMSYSKAASRLRKKLLFTFAKKCKMTNCYRCGKEIENEMNFSIEHKVGWQYSENPKEMFWDTNNIVFSHKSCNYAEAGMTHYPQGISKYKGVYYLSTEKRKKRWRASTEIKGRRYSFGIYETEIEAAIIFDREIVKILGDKAVTNKKLGLL